jgi:xylulokinase
VSLLALDFGSSSIKAAILRGTSIVGERARAAYPTHYDGPRAEVHPDDLLQALQNALRQLGGRIRQVDAIALSTMSPAWVAMDRHGKALTPIVTHQDRRSVDIAREMEKRFGRSRLLRCSGNRPIPGGISSTTCAWFAKHHPSILRKSSLIGHLNTFLHRQLADGRVIDPSNASFTGLYQTVRLGGWSDELCELAGVRPEQLPDILDADKIGGTITPAAARAFGLKAGTPMLVGLVDTSAAMLLTNPRPGSLMNACGSTDVLALCTDHPRPHDQLLTRGLGVGRLWMAVGTIAAAGSSLTWAQKQFFPDLSDKQFFGLLSRLIRSKQCDGSVNFEPYLAGDRNTLEQRQASFTGLTLATTREQMLLAIARSLAKASADRLPLLEKLYGRLKPHITLTGGADKALHHLLHHDWPDRFQFHRISDATMRGLGKLL